MEKVKEYTCVGSTPENFIKEAQALIDSGWQPIGGVSVAYGKRIIGTRPAVTQEVWWYTQAFVK